MNKLFTISFKLSNGYTVSTWYGWSEADAVEKMAKNPEWTYSVIVDNDIHKIWIAR